MRGGMFGILSLLPFFAARIHGLKTSTIVRLRLFKPRWPALNKNIGCAAAAVQGHRTEVKNSHVL